LGGFFAVAAMICHANGKFFSAKCGGLREKCAKKVGGFPQVVITADGAYKNAFGNLTLPVGVEWQLPMLSKPTPLPGPDRQ
jgi:hypothetical protein